MIVKVVEGENLSPMCYHFPDAATMQMNKPFSGWVTIISDDKAWQFNGAYVVGIVPDEMYPLRKAEAWRSL